MNKEERIKELQNLTKDYFKTAEILNMKYDEVRNTCEGGIKWEWKMQIK